MVRARRARRRGRSDAASSGMSGANGAPTLIASASAPQLGASSSVQLHLVPRFNVFGQLVPVGKGDGIGAPPARSLARALGAPQDWTRAPAFASRSVLMSERKTAHLDEMRASQSAVKIRTVAELKSSGQMQAVLTEAADARDAVGVASRSQLLAQRRADNYECLKRLAHSHVPAVQRVHAVFAANGGAAALGGAAVPLWPAAADASPASPCRPSQPAEPSPSPSPSAAAPTDCKLEVIRDRPAAPGLGWSDAARTRSAVLGARRAVLQELLETGAREFERTGPARKVARRRAREVGPLAHMEDAAHNDFGASSKDQFGTSTRSALFEARRCELFEQLEATKSAADTRALSTTQTLMEPIVRSATPWWEIGRTPEAAARLQIKQAELVASFHERRHATTADPAGGGRFRGQELARRAALKGLPGKITSSRRPDLRAAAQERHVSPSHFTDAAIEFRNQAVTPVLDAKGKKRDYDPGETAPLFSSFTKDSIFMEREERCAASEDEARREHLRRQGDKLPLRTFSLDALVAPRAGQLPVPEAEPTAHEQAAVAAFVAEVGVVGERPLTQAPPKVRTGGFAALRSS